MPLSHHADYNEIAPTGSVQVVSSRPTDGPTTCGIYAHSFPDRRLPPLNQQLTIDYTPARCMPKPVNTELPRGVDRRHGRQWTGGGARETPVTCTGVEWSPGDLNP